MSTTTEGIDGVVRMRPLFVLSIWRSGSSLLHALLNQHSQIALLYEGELPQLHLLLQSHFRDGSWREKWEFWNRAPSRHGIPLESMPTNVADAWEATRIVYREYARKKNALIWGEKSPHWYDNALRIAAKFPDAQFIFLWRDVNAVMESIERAALSERFFRKPGFLTRVLVGSEKLRQACDALRAEGRMVHELDYKDLTSSTVQCMQQISRFLDVPFEPQMASLAGADRSATFPGQHHELVRSDQVVRSTKTVNLLSSRTRVKIARYAFRWKLRYGDASPQPSSVSAKTMYAPGRLELLGDRLAYYVLILWDKSVEITYSIAPTKSAHSLRAWMRQHAYQEHRPSAPINNELV